MKFIETCRINSVIIFKDNNYCAFQSTFKTHFYCNKIMLAFEIFTCLARVLLKFYFYADGIMCVELSYLITRYLLIYLKNSFVFLYMFTNVFYFIFFSVIELLLQSLSIIICILHFVIL